MKVKAKLAQILLMVSIIVFVPLLFDIGEVAQAETDDDLFELSIEELMNMEIESSSSLTSTTRRLQPSTVTTITKEQIKASGARSLDELLDIYIPNLQLMQTGYRFPTIGLRGISSLTADKLLLLINGKEINEHTNYGALSERDLPMLTDIQRIDVVRGPGSALYGVGALAMVVNIITENAETFQGQQVTLRTGQIEEFYSGEYKRGKKFEDGSGLYTYVGIAENLGSYEQYSPMDSSHIRDWGYVRDQMGYRDQPKYKFFMDYTKGPFEFWARYTRGGVRYDKPMAWPENPEIPAAWNNYTPLEKYHEMGYQQLILAPSYALEFSDRLKADISFSYDMFDSELYYASGVAASREDKYLTKLVLEWTPNEKQSVAVGSSWLREEFGFPSPGYPGNNTEDDAYNPGCMSMIYVGMPTVDSNGVVTNRMPRWHTDTFSLFGEHQWKINDKLTNFFGIRMDKNTFTDYMFSPRATLIYTPTTKDTFKTMVSRSVRLNFASEMYTKAKFCPPWVDPNVWVPGEKTEPEVLYAYELRYERQHRKDLWLAGSIFFHDHDIKGYSWEQGAQAGTSVGNIQTYGLEVEGIYKKGKTETILSHSYTKMYDFDYVISSMTGNPVDQMFTSEPYGYGKDLAYWSNHQTKVIVRRKVNEQWTLDGSARILWGYPGGKKYNDWRNSLDSNYYPKPSSTIFDGNILLNLGLTYQAAKNLNVRIDGYNLLGIIDDDFNQNLIGFNHANGAARSYAPAVGISMNYRF